MFCGSLWNHGFMSYAADGTIMFSHDYEHIQKLKRQRQEEKANGERVAQQNQQLAQHGIDQERQRPGQQLEPNGEWANDQKL